MAGYFERSPAQASDTDDIAQFKRWYRADIEKTNAWRKEAREDYRFRDGADSNGKGGQWSDEDRQILKEQGRPVIEFNRIGVLVDAVVGAESGNRREVRYIPRENGDALANELLTSAAEWFRDQCDAEDEESEAFKDTVTCGMGWTETRLDRTDNPDGDPKIERIDPFEMAWDCNADKANLTDSKRRWRVRKMPMEEAKKLFPDVPEEALNAAWADPDAEQDNNPRSINPRERYTREIEDHGPQRQVVIAGCQYLEEEVYYKALMLTPPMMQPQIVELEEAKFKIAEKHGAIMQSVRLKRQTVMQCFLGSVMLGKAVPTQTKGFTWQCITGLKDNDKGTFYGIVRRAKDPQRWANKWLSQMLHILNSQAKGGIMAERGAFENDKDAEESWARTDRITFLERGALSGSSAKIQPKPMAQFPAGFDRLLAYADELITKATGINMELLGMREVNQPGVLEAQRKQSGMGILASFFDSLRRYRKLQGRGMLRLIQDYLSDGRMVRIVGDEKAQYVALTKEAVADVDYDIIVDDAPTSPNEKERTFQYLMQLLPMFKDAIGPAQGMLLAEYSPLPASLVEKLKKSVEEGMAQQAQQGPDPAMQMQMQAEAMKSEATKAKAQADIAKSNNDVVIAQLNVQAEREKAAGEVEKAKYAQEQRMNDAIERENERNFKAREAANANGGNSDQLAMALAAISQKLDQVASRGGGKRVVRGADGRTTHLEGDDGSRINIVRGPDGRLAGFEPMVN
jgi:hypothetical protein